MRETEISFTWAWLLVNMDGQQVDMQVVSTSSAFLFPFTIVIQLSSFLFWHRSPPLLQILPEALQGRSHVVSWGGLGPSKKKKKNSIRLGWKKIWAPQYWTAPPPPPMPNSQIFSQAQLKYSPKPSFSFRPYHLMYSK